jgi:hypothetical protein
MRIPEKLWVGAQILWVDDGCIETIIETRNDGTEWRVHYSIEQGDGIHEDGPDDFWSCASYKDSDHRMYETSNVEMILKRYES